MPQERGFLTYNCCLKRVKNMQNESLLHKIKNTWQDIL